MQSEKKKSSEAKEKLTFVHTYIMDRMEISETRNPPFRRLPQEKCRKARCCVMMLVLCIKVTYLNYQNSPVTTTKNKNKTTQIYTYMICICRRVSEMLYARSVLLFLLFLLLSKGLKYGIVQKRSSALGTRAWAIMYVHVLCT